MAVGLEGEQQLGETGPYLSGNEHHSRGLSDTGQGTGNLTVWCDQCMSQTDVGAGVSEDRGACAHKNQLPPFALFLDRSFLSPPEQKVKDEQDCQNISDGTNFFRFSGPHFQSDIR